MDHPATSPIRFRPLEQARAHEYVAEQIRRQIALHLIVVGDALPPERELARMFGVARKTVQEAVRLLVADGLIESRRGRGGGNFVLGSTDGADLTDHLLDRIRPQRDLVEQALTYRLELEPGAAALCASLRRGDDLARIMAAADRADRAGTDTQFIEHDTEFHLAIARATGNRFFTDGVEHVRVLLNDVLAALPESQLWRERTRVEHAAILAAIAGGDSENARRAMRQHVAHTNQSARALLAAL
jgi:GntR family transcriptional regulator, transcriptional repressor for pyruvate dehydrogenase complex